MTVIYLTDLSIHQIIHNIHNGMFSELLLVTFRMEDIFQINKTVSCKWIFSRAILSTGFPLFSKFLRPIPSNPGILWGWDMGEITMMWFLGQTQKLYYILSHALGFRKIWILLNPRMLWWPFQIWPENNIMLLQLMLIFLGLYFHIHLSKRSGCCGIAGGRAPDLLPFHYNIFRLKVSQR